LNVKIIIRESVEYIADRAGVCCHNLRFRRLHLYREIVRLSVRLEDYTATRRLRYHEISARKSGERGKKIIAETVQLIED